MASADSRRAVRLSVAVATPDSLRGTTRGLASWLVRAAPARARGDVVLALVSDGRMRALNRAYRGMDYATDVLSFPAAPDHVAAGLRPSREASARLAAAVRPQRTANYAAWSSRSATRRGGGGQPRLERSDIFLGDIVIASGVAARQARTAGHSLQTELRVLALHGLLHLLGFDHETDDGRMARTERRLRRAAGLKEGLIERSPR